MDYKEPAAKALQIAWRHRWVWVFGFFAGGGFAGANWTFSPRSLQSGPQGIHAQALWRRFEILAREHLAIVLIVAGLLIFMALLLASLGVIAQGSLVGAAEGFDDGIALDFSGTLGIGLANFWRLLSFYLVLGLIGLLVFIILGLVSFAVLIATSGSVLIALLALVSASIVFFPALVVVGIIGALGTPAVVIEKSGPAQTLLAVWRLFIGRLGPVLAVWLIGIGITVVFSLALLAVGISLVLPLVLGAYLLFSGGFTLFKLAVVVFSSVAVIAFLLTARAAFAAYLSIYWALAYRRLTAPDFGL